MFVQMLFFSLEFGKRKKDVCQLFFFIFSLQIIKTRSVQ